MASTLVLIGTFIDAPTPKALRIRKDHICVVSPAGKITHIGPYDPSEKGAEILAGLPTTAKLLKSQFIVPGFIDCHCHSAQYYQLGTKTDFTLFDWLTQVTFPNEAKCSSLPYATSLYTRLVRRLLRNGTTTVQYFATNHLEATKELARICGSMGQRALVGKVCADQNSPDYYVEETAQSIEDTEEFITWVFAQEFGKGDEKAPLIRPVITPRFIPTCSLPLLRSLGDLAKKYNVHVQSHAAETPHQVKMVHDLHPNLGGGRDVAIFESVGLLTDKTCYAHGCHLRDPEVAQMAEVGASVASCPYANMLHSFSVTPIPRMHGMGLRVGLGTDIAGGYNSSMMGVGRLSSLGNRTESFMPIKRKLEPGESEWPEPYNPSTEHWIIDWTYAFHLATAGGAAALHLEDEIGTLDVGKEFDALFVDVDVDGQAFEFWEEEDVEEWVERWWNTGDDRNLIKVWVQGREVASA